MFPGPQCTVCPPARTLESCHTQLGKGLTVLNPKEEPPNTPPSLPALTHSLADPGVRVHVEAGPALALVAAFQVHTELTAGVRLLALINICVCDREKVLSREEEPFLQGDRRTKHVSSSGRGMLLSQEADPAIHLQ